MEIENSSPFRMTRAWGYHTLVIPNHVTEIAGRSGEEFPDRKELY
jgi:hypothetical protein